MLLEVENLKLHFFPITVTGARAQLLSGDQEQVFFTEGHNLNLISTLFIVHEPDNMKADFLWHARTRVRVPLP